MLLILGFVVVTFLIFKLIKKIVVAIFSFVFLILIIVGAVFGVVYLDYNYLASQNNFDVNIIYGNSDSSEFGVTIPIVDKQPDLTEISNFDVKTITDEILNAEEGDFNIFVNKSLFNNLLNDNNDYYLIGTKDLVYSGIEIESKLTKSQVLEIINSNDGFNTYVDILFELNGEPELMGVSLKPMIKTELNNNLDEMNIGLKEALFLSVFEEISTDSNAGITLIQGFKNDELEIYPQRFSFGLIKYLPVDTLTSFIPENSIIEK